MTLELLEQQLNPDQLEAVCHGSGPQLVLAGAGSGKTRVITYRIAWLIQKQAVAPYRIAAVTFTNKAASEMAERVEMLAGREGVFVGTFHRFCVRLLRRYGDRVGLSRDFTILDTSDQITLIKRALEAEQLSDKSFPPRAVLGRISSAKNRLVGPNDFELEAESFFDRKVVGVYRRYDGLLRQAGGVDFDDLILHAVRLLREDEELGRRMRGRLAHLLVDEFQDTNHAQLALVQTLVGEDGNLTAVGDEDQGIYRWRGAKLENILDFEANFPHATIRKLEQNYRSTQVILDASGGVVAHNENRRGKKLWTAESGGETLRLYEAADEIDEARWIGRQIRARNHELRYRDMAVLLRTNAQTRAIEDELLKRKIPYCLIAGVRFYERAEIKDLIAYLRVIRNPQDNLSLRRILNQPPRGIGKATQEQLFATAEEMGHSIWDALRFGSTANLPQRGARALLAFRSLIEKLRAAAQEEPIGELLSTLLEHSGYSDLLNKRDEESEARRENVEELISAAQDFCEQLGYEAHAALESLEESSSAGHEDVAPSEAPADDAQPLPELEPTNALTAFLDYVALVSDTDGLDTEVGVSLMTLHSAKGLEFPMVFLAGLEDGLLPHFNSQGSREELEEERRLLYVGMTRAERSLYLSTCARRRIAGRYQDQLPSPFLEEIPEDLVEVQTSPDRFRGPRTRGVYSFFDRQAEAPDDFNQESDHLEKGAQVRHRTLGEGVVLEVDGTGEKAKLTIFFRQAGKRKLIAKYAALERL